MPVIKCRDQDPSEQQTWCLRDSWDEQQNLARRPVAGPQKHYCRGRIALVQTIQVLYQHSSSTAQIACWLECRTHNGKVASSNPGRSGRRIFFSKVNFVCWLLFGVHYTPVLPQWHIKDPGHSAKSAGGRLHLNTHTPLTHRSRGGLTMPMSRQSVGIYQETSSHATREGSLGHSRFSSLSHCGLILA